MRISSTRMPGLSNLSNGKRNFAEKLSRGSILAFLPQVIIIEHNRTCLKGNWKYKYSFSSWVLNLKPNATICIKYKATAISLLALLSKRTGLPHFAVLIHTSLNTPRWGWGKNIAMFKKSKKECRHLFLSIPEVNVVFSSIFHPSFF